MPLKPQTLSFRNPLIFSGRPANRQGRIAADNMLDRHSLYHGSQGTSICKVFSLSIGSVGANEKQLKVHGTRYEKVYVHAADHAGYYPGATMISLKLLFSPDTGKILGLRHQGKKGLINASMSCLSHSARGLPSTISNILS
jgi:NADPH-dependent 2,4-dienoyl-CoA reductase/sulfur reductase-like enzyme